MSPAIVHHVEAVFSFVRKIYERGPDDPVDDLGVNMAIWGIFLNTTFQAAVILDKTTRQFLRFVKNHLWNSVRQLFNDTGKSDQWTNRNHWCEHIISKNSCGCRQAYRAAQLIRSPTPKPTSSATECSVWEQWEMILLQPERATLNGIRKNNHFKDMNRLDGMPTEFSSEESWRWASSRRLKGNTERCEYNSQTVANYARRFSRGHWSFLGLRSEKTWYGTYTDKQIWRIMESISREYHPICRASSAFESGEWRSKGHGKKAVHFNGGDENIELLLRTVISANQLSIYGAVADLCHELFEAFGASEKPEAPDHLETMEIPTGPSIAETQPLHSNGETWCQNTRCLETTRGLVRRRGFERLRESAQSWTWKFAVMKIDTVLKFWSSLCFKTEQLLRIASWMVLIVRDRMDANQGRRGYGFGETHC